VGWVGLGQSADGLGWIGSHKMDPWTTLIQAALDSQLALNKRFFLDRVINVWNALPPAVNFTSLDVLRIASKRLIFLVFLFVCNIILVQ